VFHPTLHICRTLDRSRGPEPGGALVPVEEKRTSTGNAGALVCVDCAHPITTEAARIERGGAHVHERLNPAGIRFRVGCFREAPGAVALGDETAYFTWFAGFAWTVAACGLCCGLAGWRYRSPVGEQFYGLILDRLRNSGAGAGGQA
jgi:hypothetical protein